mmetsp:Transcript_67/g.346  ORF Transcript_67/g.346 Transcript_67/m.346 type:complete len:693 (-) Transcript_67:970-3048(-)
MCVPRQRRRPNTMKQLYYLPLQILLLLCLAAAVPFLAIAALLHDSLLYMFVGRCWLYSCFWEDTSIDRRVLNLKDDDHVITIASAGCNVLDYLIEGAEVTAVDFNVTQIALVDMKKVCIQLLSFEDFFAIFASQDIDVLRKHYPELKKHLLPASVEFWDGFLPNCKSILYSGSSGQLAWFLSRFCFPLAGLGWIVECVRNETPKEEFIRIAQDHEMQLKMMAWLVDTVLYRFSCLFAGVPKRQLDLGAHRPNSLERVLQHIIYNTDLCRDNHFYAGYLLGYWTETNCPRYCRREHYEKLRESINAGKLHLVHGTFVSACEAAKGRPFTVASLLDHMDWMPIPDISSEINTLASKMDTARGRVFWRSYADTIHSPPLMWLKPLRVDDTGDRVGMYFSTWIAHLDDTPIEPSPRIDTLAEAPRGIVHQLWTGIKIVTFPVLQSILSLRAGGKSKHAKAMEAFYAHQKGDYDSFREKLLLARPWLMHSFPMKKAGGLVWVDVGGGTARNLEFLPVELIREKFKKIVVLDVSPSLLEQAQRRVASMGIEDIVEIVEEDFTSENAFKALPQKGTVDVVTMSYSLSMIPDKEAAVRHAAALLKPNGEGVLGVADFFTLPTCMVRKENPSTGLTRLLRNIESVFHKEWFAQDHVFLLSEEVVGYFDRYTTKLWDERERGQVPFLPFLQPFHGILLAESK